MAAGRTLIGRFPQFSLNETVSIARPLGPPRSRTDPRVARPVLPFDGGRLRMARNLRLTAADRIGFRADGRFAIICRGRPKRRSGAKTEQQAPDRNQAT